MEDESVLLRRDGDTFAVQWGSGGTEIADDVDRVA